MTYGELKAHLAARLHGRDLSSLLPDFVGRAHAVIAREVHVTVDLTLAGATAALPADLGVLTLLRLTTGGGRPLAAASAAEMAGAGSGAPRMYRVAGGGVVVAPSPDGPYPAKLTYRVSPAPFTQEADTNAGLTRYPLLYVHGALAEIKRHLEDGDGEARYEAMFRAEMAQINAEALDAAFAGRLQTQPSVAA